MTENKQHGKDQSEKDSASVKGSQLKGTKQKIEEQISVKNECHIAAEDKFEPEGMSEKKDADVNQSGSAETDNSSAPGKVESDLEDLADSNLQTADGTESTVLFPSGNNSNCEKQFKPFLPAKEQKTQRVSPRSQTIKATNKPIAPSIAAQPTKVNVNPLATKVDKNQSSIVPENNKTIIRPRIKAEAANASDDGHTGYRVEANEKVVTPKKTTHRSSTSENTVIEQSGSQVEKKPAQQSDTIGQIIGPGSILKERFDLLEEIGSGGMGIVYKALDRRDVEAGNSNFIAIKVLHEEYKADPDLLKALHSEARKTQQLAHPNIITVYDFDRDGDSVFMTMEYIQGIPLNQVINAHPKGLALNEALDIIEQLARALEYAHSRHVIHSDFKPGNIFIDRNNHVKVLDFGIARLANMARQRDFDPGVLGGMTPAYASLEMIKREFPDPRDDVYALACVAYELLCGKHPYNRNNAEQAAGKKLQPKPIKSLNGRQWKTLKKGLALHRDQRIGNVDDLIKGLHGKSNAYLYFLGFAGSVSLMLMLWMSGLITTGKQQIVNDPNPVPASNDTVAIQDEPVVGAIEPRLEDEESVMDAPTPITDVYPPEIEESEVLVVKEDKIKLWPEKNEYQLEEELKVNFSVEEPMYVRIVVINSIGEVFELFPNPYQKENYCKPGVIYQIPTKDSELTITITGPKGIDKMVAVAAKQPFPAEAMAFSDSGKLIWSKPELKFTRAEIDYIIK